MALLCATLAGCGTQAPDGSGDDGSFAAVVDDVVAAPPAPAVAPTPSAAPLPAAPASAAAAPTPPAGAAAVPTATPVVQAAAADPVWLSIPTIGVDTSTIQLDLRADEAEVPESFHVAGWYRQTVEPGTDGPAVMVGHVGSRAGPGVFARLDELRPGDEILVTDEVGTVRTFVVDRGALVDKYDRPADVLGRGEERPELRLITCGGEFDAAAGHHVSNYVVWAHER